MNDPMRRLTNLTKAKRADRREAKKHAPCPHDWMRDGEMERCRICKAWAKGDGTVTHDATTRRCDDCGLEGRHDRRCSWRDVTGPATKHTDALPRRGERRTP